MFCSTRSGTIHSHVILHQANFPQYDFFGYVPNAPGAMRQPPPSSKDEVDERFIVATLPSMATSLDQVLGT